MSGMQTSRSDATNSVDKVAQLRDLRETGVPERSHGCGGVEIHCLVRVDMGGMFARSHAGFCRALWAGVGRGCGGRAGSDERGADVSAWWYMDGSRRAGVWISRHRRARRRLASSVLGERKGVGERVCKREQAVG